MKKAIIIGATSGIGKELAKLLAGNNYKVGLTGLFWVMPVEKTVRKTVRLTGS